MTKKIVNKLDASDLRFIEEMKKKVTAGNYTLPDVSRKKYDAETSARWLVDKLVDFNYDVLFDKHFWMVFLLEHFSEEFGYE